MKYLSCHERGTRPPGGRLSTELQGLFVRKDILLGSYVTHVLHTARTGSVEYIVINKERW